MVGLTFDNARAFVGRKIASGGLAVQTSPRTAPTSHPDAQTLSQALTIAWDLLVAADDPATAKERAEETRRQMARQLVRTAGTSHEMVDLWMAALSAVASKENAFRRAG